MTRSVLITGSTRGIGLGIARALGGEGCDLALNGLRGPQAVADTLETLRRETGRRVTYHPADIGRRQDREALIAGVLAEHGRIDVLVNNAGVAPQERRDLLEASEESFERVVGTNLQGTYFLTQAVARHMLATTPEAGAPSRCIVLITSVSVELASSNRGEYCVAKAGLSMAAKLFATRLGPAGIGVYEVRPGITRTDMTAAVQDKYDRLIADGLCVQPRWGLPEDVGKAVASLVRGDFPYSTGQAFTVDGGLTVPRL